MNYDYCLNNNGILAFKIDDEYNIKGNNELNNNENLENESKEQIRNILIDLTFNLFIKNPITSPVNADKVVVIIVCIISPPTSLYVITIKV
jgi:hypothetical protein